MASCPPRAGEDPAPLDVGDGLEWVSDDDLTAGAHPGIHVSGASRCDGCGRVRCGGCQVAESMTPGMPGRSTQHDDVSEVWVGELIGDVSRDLSTLMRQELEPPRRSSSRRPRRPVSRGTLGGAGFAGYMLVLSCPSRCGGTGQRDGSRVSRRRSSRCVGLIGAALYLLGRRHSARSTRLRNAPSTPSAKSRRPHRTMKESITVTTSDDPDRDPPRDRRSPTGPQRQTWTH